MLILNKRFKIKNIIENELIIGTLPRQVNITQGGWSCVATDENDGEYSINKNTLVLGSGSFGKEFEVR